MPTAARFIFVLTLNICLGGCAGFSSRGVAVSQNENIRVPILLYHHVQELPHTASTLERKWTLTPKNFETQMDWLSQHGFHTITLAQLVMHLKHGLPLLSNPIVLSFDDGWKEHYRIVFRSLVKHNFVGTFFITTDSVGHSAFVSWAQLKEMSAAGMDIEAHSLTHPHLELLPYKEAFREIIESKRAIESHLNKPVVVFAYPFGSYNDHVIEMVKRAGFEGATTVNGINGGYIQRADQSYTLSRFAVTGNKTAADLARLLF